MVCVPSKRKNRWTGELDAPADPEDEVSPAAPKQYGDSVPGLTYKGWAHDNPNRKYLLNLPPVVGNYQEWSNKCLKYNSFPEDLDDVREKLFKMEKPMLFNSQQFADYWPHISNFYNRSSTPVEESNGTEVGIWECRNKARLSRNKREYPSSSTGRRKRDNKSRLLESNESCQVRFRIVMYFKHADTDEPHKSGLDHCRCVPEWMYLERKRHSLGHEHNHTLESLDQFKWSDAMLLFAQRKVEDGGYMYASVSKWIKEKLWERTKQVQFMTSHDVANAARRWRVLNRDLELVETIEDPSPVEEGRKRCFDLIGTTSVEGLKKALVEVCTKMPEAARLVMPFLEAAQEARNGGDEGNNKVMEGDEIVVPEPGLPPRKQTGRPVIQPNVSPVMQRPSTQELRGLPAAPTVAETDYSAYLQVPGTRIAPRLPYPVQSQQTLASDGVPPTQPAQQPLPPQRQWQQPPLTTPQPVQQQYSSSYSYPQPHQSATAMPPPPVPASSQQGHHLAAGQPRVVQYTRHGV